MNISLSTLRTFRMRGRGRGATCGKKGVWAVQMSVASALKLQRCALPTHTPFFHGAHSSISLTVFVCPCPTPDLFVQKGAAASNLLCALYTCRVIIYLHWPFSHAFRPPLKEAAGYCCRGGQGPPFLLWPPPYPHLRAKRQPS